MLPFSHNSILMCVQDALDIRAVPLSTCYAPATSASTSSMTSSGKPNKRGQALSSSSDRATARTCSVAPDHHAFLRGNGTESDQGQHFVAAQEFADFDTFSSRQLAATPKMEVEGRRISPHEINTLPPHIKAEAASLRDQADSCGLKLTEHVCRPLVQSTAIWLLRHGVTHTSSHPGVFRKVGRLLHDHKLLPLSVLHAGSNGKVIPFESRLEEFMKNKIRSKTAHSSSKCLLKSNLTRP